MNRHDALTVYFDGEKYAGLLLAGVAVAIIIAATIMFRAGTGFRSFAVTLGVVALAEIVLGVGLYVRTGPQVRRFDEQLRSNAATFYSMEAERMTRVQKNFVIVEYVELFMIFVSAAVAFARKDRPGVAGVALGLLISASVLLAFDVFAERRGAEYLTAIANGKPST